MQAGAESGDVETVRILLGKGARMDGRIAHHFGRSPLQGAAENGHLEVVEMLLKAGADVNAGPSKYRGVTGV